MKLIIAIVNIILLSAYMPICAQTEFFKSKIIFSESHLLEFYSSFSIDSNQIYFNANDYELYAYSKKTGSL